VDVSEATQSLPVGSFFSSDGQRRLQEINQEDQCAKLMLNQLWME